MKNYCETRASNKAVVYADDKLFNFVSDTKSSTKLTIHSITEIIISAFSSLKTFQNQTKLDNKKLRRTCIEQIKKIFTNNVRRPGAIGLAYHFLCLYRMGVPQKLIASIPIEDAVAMFNKAIDVNYAKEKNAIQIITKGITDKNLDETVYGFILLWFTKKWKSPLSEDLRRQAVECLI